MPTRPIRSFLKALTMIACVVLAFSWGISAQSYGFDIWTTANGLPQNTVTGLAQSPDGYLWLSTFDGLARFDGVRFRIFNTGNTKGIVSNRFTHVLVDREGTLFATTDNQIVTVLRNGVFKSFQQPPGSFESNSSSFLKADAVGNTVIETDIGDFYLRDGQFVLIEGQKIKGRRTTFFGKSGVRWVFERDRIERVEGDRTTSFDIELNEHDLEAAWALRPFADAFGGLWISQYSPRRIIRLDKSGAASIYSAKEIPEWNGNLVTTAVEAPDGSITLLLGTVATAKPAQILKFKEGRWSIHTLNDVIYSTDGLIDREGNLWLGTASGLRRLKTPHITGLTARDGLNGNEIYPLFQTAEGAVLIGSSLGVNRLANGRISDLREYYSHVGGNVPIVSSGLYADSKDGIWIGYNGGFRRSVGGSLKIAATCQGSATDFTEDRDGNIWISTGEGLLKYNEDKEIRRFTVADGLPAATVVLTHLDRSGQLWAGTLEGIAVLRGDRFVDFRSDPESPKGYVRSIHEDGDGVLWFGTYGNGLYRYKDGRFFNFRSEHGLFNDGVFAILEDRRGNFWMSCNRGIFRVAIQELNDFAEGKVPKLNSVSYDEKDGMPSSECNGGRSPAAIRAADGKLWFGTIGGVAVVDPEAEEVNPHPPPVIIEAISIDRKPAEIRDGQVELRPGQSNITIEYTGVSLVRSEQVRFRYKLEGLEDEWVEAGTKRGVDYTYLPAGTYTFRVIAANANGVWNNEGAAVRIVVRPYFYRTWWFIGLCAVLLGSIVWLGYHARVSRLRAIADARAKFSRQLIESQEAERKRIASELHDGLGQNLVVIKNRAELGLNWVDENQEAARELTSISESASHALEEVREITNNLRPRLLDRIGLTKAIESMLKKISDLIEIKREIDQIDGLFDENQEISIYRIIQEAVNNIVKHSNASDAVVTIKRRRDEVYLEISDNGQGFETALEEKGRRNMGLAGIRERAQLLGAALTIDSKRAEGTRISLTIPVTKTK